MSMSRYKKTGWFNESYRHYLAAKGIKTKTNYFARIDDRPGFRPKGTPVPGHIRTRPRVILPTEKYLELLQFSPEKQKVLEAKYRKKGLSEDEVQIEVNKERDRLRASRERYNKLKEEITELQRDLQQNKVTDANVSFSKLKQRAEENLIMAENPDEVKAAINERAAVEAMSEEFKKQREIGKKLFEKQKAVKDMTGAGIRGGVPVGVLANSQLLTKKEQYGFHDKDTDVDFPALSVEQQQQMVKERRKKLHEELQEFGSAQGIIDSGQSSIPKEVLVSFRSLRSRTRGASVIPAVKTIEKAKPSRNTKEERWTSSDSSLTVKSGGIPWTKSTKLGGRAKLVHRAAESQATQMTPHDSLADLKKLESQYVHRSEMVPKDARRLRALIHRAKENIKLSRSEANVPKSTGISGGKFERNLPKEIVFPRIKKKNSKFSPWGEQEKKEKRAAAAATEKAAKDVARANEDIHKGAAIIEQVKK